LNQMRYFKGLYSKHTTLVKWETHSDSQVSFRAANPHAIIARFTIFRPK